MSIPAILKLADALAIAVKSVRYTRGSFIFPGAQPFPHRSFMLIVNLFLFLQFLLGGVLVFLIANYYYSFISAAYSNVSFNFISFDDWETISITMIGFDFKWFFFILGSASANHPEIFVVVTYPLDFSYRHIIIVFSLSFSSSSLLFSFSYSSSALQHFLSQDGLGVLSYWF